MQEIGEHFQLIDQLTFLLIETSLDQSWAESKRVFKDIFTGSPLRLLALVLLKQGRPWTNEKKGLGLTTCNIN